MSQVTANPTVTIAPPVVERTVSIEQLIATLYGRTGCAFASMDADYDADEKMKKRNNPFYGQGLRKLSKTEVMVTFDYDKSMEKRGDEAAKNGKTWSQAVTREDGSLTPLSVHKADIVTPQSPGQRLVLKDGARAYLRCEFRSTKSRYIDAEGNEVAYELIKPHLKATGKDDRTVKFHTVGLKNVTKLRLDGQSFKII